MLAMRWPSWTRPAAIGLGADMTRGLPARNVPERGADCHADAGDVSVAQYVAGHDFAGGKDVGRRPVVAQDNLRTFVDGHTQIGKRDAGAQRVSEKRWRIDGPRPMRLRRHKSLRRAIVENGVIEGARAQRRI